MIPNCLLSQQLLHQFINYVHVFMRTCAPSFMDQLKLKDSLPLKLSWSIDQLNFSTWYSWVTSSLVAFLNSPAMYHRSGTFFQAHVVGSMYTRDPVLVCTTTAFWRGLNAPNAEKTSKLWWPVKLDQTREEDACLNENNHRRRCMEWHTVDHLCLSLLAASPLTWSSGEIHNCVRSTVSFVWKSGPWNCQEWKTQTVLLMVYRTWP